MSQMLQIILGIVALFGSISGFLVWHFNTLHKLKDQVQELKLEMKELEKKDDLQQQTLDQLKELYPIIRIAFETLNNKTK
jgi:uncharacterized membrane protein (DUF106 family)